MIRFRNPSSSLETMLASFEELYNALKDKEFFNNDDIAKVLAKANLMASSGFTGDAALSLGANKDKSRDKTYNNAKMFAEIYRLLGLISVVNSVSSNYRFTFIGDHMVVPGADKKAIIEQCVLGMNNPNRIMDVSYDESVRFFSCVLRSMKELDGIIHRDEMILGPMCVNDNSFEEFSEMIGYIKSIRGDNNRLQGDLKKLAKSLQDNKKEGMTVESVQNCTRIPISILKYCGWVESTRSKIYGRSMSFMKLTEHGYETVDLLNQLHDIRLSDYDDCSEREKRALIRLGTYMMLARAKFNIETVKEDLQKDFKEVKKISSGKEVLFSPYQTLEYSIVNKALNIKVEKKNTKEAQKESLFIANTYAHVLSGQVHNMLIDKDVDVKQELITQNIMTFSEHVNELYKSEKDIHKLTQMLVKEHIKDKKSKFYPLVETLFRVIGVDCHKSRDGVNGERWDAMIRDHQRSIPIEIKSPTEEMHISIKAIRQALENKIILLSRRTYETDKKTSSFAVGYYPPNERAEVSDLIANIKKIYGYSIAVFDIGALLNIAVNIILFKKGIDIERLYGLEGIVNVDDIIG